MGFGCMRALITRESAFIFDAHKPTIKVRMPLIFDRFHRSKFRRRMAMILPDTLHIILWNRSLALFPLDFPTTYNYNTKKSNKHCAYRNIS